MNIWAYETWTYEKHSEAEAQYRALLAQGCKAQMRLAYAGSGWTVSIPRC
jgi:hypothetical protein